MPEDLLYEVENRIAYLTINRPEAGNSINEEVVSLFSEYLDRAERDDNVMAVCVSGAGGKVFCAGADLSGSMKADNVNVFQKYADLLKKLARYPKPTVAKINGHCLAGGTGFMLSCDIVIAADTAKFGTPEVNVGLFPLMIGAVIFKNVLRKKAMEMILLGNKLTAEEALEMGMLTKTTPPEKLDEETDKTLNVLREKSSIGMKIGKEAFHRASKLSFEDSLDYLAGKLKEVSATEDAREGISAFLERRKPTFKGK